ncbi:uncharacterized protein B0H18DRAFT_1082063 [Fomitopsis serialis]|uniref:uncharacterized protein n=1 Tax=Fomitopsis serialis TaxID=139415 RepID=UPI00200729EE|nr:uncharacterized protein B0H18DRAFT_1082063 [Neoantrodia serialis]KAH9936529.1 hypothetical protein B0H18DRAFT_1082063 [Neoantrodia serialis]
MAASSLRRIAVVTGAAQGIGRSIALRLSKDGLSVAVNDVPSKRKQLEEVVSDITCRDGRQAIADEVQAMTANVVEQLGGLDVMVANTAICHCAELADYWDKIMMVNLRGTMLSYRYAALQMIQQGLSSISAYAASKFGVRGLTQCAALELVKHNIALLGLPPSRTPPPANPDVIASLVSYLPKPEAYFITGQTISVDGGLTFD